jgi:acyl-CoA reductase-like NAD-dependent aldehyde dehydrogenase
MLMGCTVVLKPSPYTPYQALILAEMADEAGIPKGVLNIVTGGKEVGEALTTDPRVDLVSFTGSDAVGSAIQAQSAPTLKRVLLELGGKSALIVRPDADIQGAAMAGLMGFTIHAGQGCALLTRHLVHNSVRAQYTETLKAMVGHVKIGNPADPATGMGPLIREVARARTESYVGIARSQGARLVAGGARPAGLDKGFFYAPTLFDNVENHHRIAQEEVFGPIGIIIGYDSDEEAISLANDSAFGLSGGIYSANVGRAYEMALQLRTGGVAINGGGGKMSSHAPFGGIKRSGYGREYGLEGLNEFTTIKTISFKGG